MTSETNYVEREVRVAARAKTIFPFLTDSDKITRWMGVTAELDPRPGGIYRIDVTGQDIASGAFVEISPYSKVVFTFGWESEDTMVSPGTSTVEITLTEDGGSTIVRLRHSDLPELDRESHGMGWDHYLGRLVIAAVGDDPGPDPWKATDAGS
jgi:uncharacterized protein YndB with AHSA1/START domain